MYDNHIRVLLFVFFELLKALGETMIKKVVDTFKAMLLVLACILVPLLIGMYFLKSAARNDAANCVDTFIVSEGTGLSKYISLQFANTPDYIDSVFKKVESKLSEDEKELQKHLRSVIKDNSDVVNINIYKEDGKLLATSLENDTPDDIDAEDNDYKNLGDNIRFSLDQLDNNEVVVKYLTQKTVSTESEKEDEKTQKQKIFFEIVLKWSKYENYMMNLQKGSFSRMFYIVSPDCNRYVSINSLPANKKNVKTSIALGLHLVKKRDSIKNGLSSVKIDSYPFKVYKEEIIMPKEMVGHNFFIIEATDESTVNGMLEELTSSIPTIVLMLIAAWLFLCLFLSRFYTRTKEQLDISTAISGATPLAIVIFRVSDGKIMQINMSALTLFRIGREAVDKVDFWKLFLYEDDRHYISNAIASNVNVLNYEVLVQSYSGGSFWSVCSASPIEIEEQPCIILAALDINRRKEIEKKLANNAALLEIQIKERTEDLEIKAKQLEDSNALLEKSRLAADEANAAKTKFLANMSNELKTPINAIIGYSEILEEEALDRKDTVSADDLHKIISSAKHLLSLIDEILDLSSIESGKTQLFFENVDITNLIKDVESVTMPLVTNNDNSLFLEIGKNIGVMYTDATKLRQCLLNLLSNAAKFTQFGKITLRVTPVVKGGIDFIDFSVIDTGSGIAPDQIENIFDSFQNNQGKSSGAGLGLSITKKYAEVMGGSVSVESELGAGSKFSIKIPRTATVESSDTVIVKNHQAEEEIFDDEEITTNEENGVTIDTDADRGYSLSANSSEESKSNSENDSSDSDSNNKDSTFGRKSDI